MNLKPLALACAALAAVAAAPAHAAFTGAYGAGNWTATSTNGGNGTASVSSDGVALTLTSADFFAGDSPGRTTLDYSITLAAPTTISFDWGYVSDDVSSTKDPFGYAVNGVATRLSANDVAGFIEQDGTATLTLKKGDTFSFQASSVDSVFGASTTRITGFSAVGAVPEPAPAVLMLVGAGLLAGAARRRRQD